MIFKGSAVALVTPFNKQNEIDYLTLKNLIEFQIASGTKAIVILGTTGESATISNEERTKIIKFCASQIGKRIPLIVGTGSNSTATAILHSKEAQRLGADAILVVTPYYNKTSQEGLILHYKTIAKSTKLPLIIYNVPSRTGINILPKTILTLSKVKNIVGLKDAGGNISQSMELLQTLPKNFALYSGDDLITYSLMNLGYHGVISVTANAYPDMVACMCDDILHKNHANALRIHNELYQINKALFLEVNPICIKYYLNLIGRDVGNPRLPLINPRTQTRLKLNSVRNIYEH